MSYPFITELEAIIRQRKSEAPENSYVAKMFERGLDKIAQKVGEEAVETVIAAKNDDDYEFIYESADLFFHLLMLCEARGIPFEKVIQALEQRNKKP